MKKSYAIVLFTCLVILSSIFINTADARIIKRCLDDSGVCVMLDWNEQKGTGALLLRNNANEHRHVFLNLHTFTCGGDEMGRKFYLGDIKYDMTSEDIFYNKNGKIWISPEGLRKMSHHLHFYIAPKTTLVVNTISCKRGLKINWNISAWVPADGARLVEIFKELNPNWSDLDRSK